MVRICPKACVYKHKEIVKTTDNVEMKVDGTTLGSGTLFLCRNCFAWGPTNRDEVVIIRWKQIRSISLAHEPSKCVTMKLGDCEDAVDQDPQEHGDYGTPVAELSLMIPSDIDVESVMKTMKALRESSTCCAAPGHDHINERHRRRGNIDGDDDLPWYDAIRCCSILCFPVAWAFQCCCSK